MSHAIIRHVVGSSLQIPDDAYGDDGLVRLELKGSSSIGKWTFWLTAIMPDGSSHGAGMLTADDSPMMPAEALELARYWIDIAGNELGLKREAFEPTTNDPAQPTTAAAQLTLRRSAAKS